MWEETGLWAVGRGSDPRASFFKKKFSETEIQRPRGVALVLGARRMHTLQNDLHGTLVNVRQHTVVKF